nr:MAG TPA_asm: hypothetical protein [Caudoviricetes sp.]
MNFRPITRYQRLIENRKLKSAFNTSSPPIGNFTLILAYGRITFKHFCTIFEKKI